MTEPKSGAEFRAEATRLFNLITRVLIVGIFCVAFIGWLLWGYLGLAIGAVLGIALAFIVWFPVALIYAMTQDGG